VIASYTAGRLASSGLDAIEAHLDVCSPCARVVIEALAGDREVPAAPPRRGPHIFQPGQLIAGRYEIVNFLGAGGMGEVYEANDRELGDRLALKTVSAAVALDTRAVARFRAEAQLARRVTHRNVCRIFDIGVHMERGAQPDMDVATPFLTMELIRGRSLSDHIRDGQSFGLAEALGVIRQIAQGLEAAHEAGVLHRDLKSDNVLLVPSSSPETVRAVITDFGLAAAMTAETDSSTGTSATWYGTRPYLAPERLAGAPARVTSDIYALGVMMYEVATGRLAIARRVAAGVGDLSRAAPLRPIIDRCMATDPKARFASASELVAALAQTTGAATTAVAAPAGHTGPGLFGRAPRRVFWILSATVAAAFAAFPYVRSARSHSQTPRSSVVGGPSVREAAGPATPEGPGVAMRAPASAPERPQVRRTQHSVPARRRVPPVGDLLVAAEKQLRLGQIEAACVTGRDVAARAPERPEAWELLGRCYMRLGDPEQARACYRRYLELAPQGEDAVFVRAIIGDGSP
jgi:hypothetical protein